MTELKHPYPSVEKSGIRSYGGSQKWLEKRYMQKSACGVIACTDLLLYLHRYRTGCAAELFSDDPGEGAIPVEVYNRWVEHIRRHYLPVIPNLGTFGIEGAAALNRYFRRHGISLRASWSVRKGSLWRSIEAMLENDIPVILAVGANFPIPLHWHKLAFYRPDRKEPACRTAAHFVTVTAIDGERLRISSWGREYYIRREELWEYARRYSTFVLSSIMWVWPA